MDGFLEVEYDIIFAYFDCISPIFDLQNQVAQASILLFRPISPKNLMGALCRYAAGLWSGDIPSTFAELAIQVEKKTIFLRQKKYIFDLR